MARQALVNRAAGTSRMITPVYKSPVGSAPFEPRLRKKLQDMVLADAVLGIQVPTRFLALHTLAHTFLSQHVSAGVRLGGSFHPAQCRCWENGSTGSSSCDPQHAVPVLWRVPCCDICNHCRNCQQRAIGCVARAVVLPASVTCVCTPTAFGEPLAVRWPAFGVNGKDRVTVADLLKCRSGVEGALPNRLSTYSTFSPQELDNVAAQIAEKPYEVLGECLPASSGNTEPSTPVFSDCTAECLKPVEGVFDSGPRNPQELVSYLYYGWGWAAAGYISSICGKPIAAAVNGVYPILCVS